MKQCLPTFPDTVVPVSVQPVPPLTVVPARVHHRRMSEKVHATTEEDQMIVPVLLGK